MAIFPVGRIGGSVGNNESSLRSSSSSSSSSSSLSTRYRVGISRPSTWRPRLLAPPLRPSPPSLSPLEKACAEVNKTHELKIRNSALCVMESANICFSENSGADLPVMFLAMLLGTKKSPEVLQNALILPQPLGNCNFLLADIFFSQYKTITASNWNRRNGVTLSQIVDHAKEKRFFGLFGNNNAKLALKKMNVTKEELKNRNLNAIADRILTYAKNHP